MKSKRTTDGNGDSFALGDPLYIDEYPDKIIYLPILFSIRTAIKTRLLLSMMLVNNTHYSCVFQNQYAHEAYSKTFEKYIL